MKDNLSQLIFPKLFIPGPVQVNSLVLQQQTKQMVNHRGPYFSRIISSISSNLAKLYLTNPEKAKSKIFTLSSSGTGAVEAAFVNLVEKNDRVLCIDNGWFGARLTVCAQNYCDNVKTLNIPWGKAPSLEQINQEIVDFKPTIISVVHNDTSTGVCNPLKEICALANENNSLIIVDSVSGLGGSPLNFDSLGIDICASSSQKCVGSTPGVSYLAVSEDAWQKINKRQRIPSMYFDLKKYEKFLSDGQTPYTPNISAYFALEQALQIYFDTGLEKNIEKHAKAAKLCQTKLTEKGYSLFAQENYRSNTLTTFKAENAVEIKEKLLASGFEISLGMAEFSKSVCRIGHMGEISFESLESVLDLL